MDIIIRDYQQCLMNMDNFNTEDVRDKGCDDIILFNCLDDDLFISVGSSIL